MPEEFDPAWEYYVADSEILEILASTRSPSIDTLPFLKGYNGPEYCFSINRTIGRFNGGRPTIKECGETFAELWKAGFSSADIMSALDIQSYATLFRWRRVLDLPARGRILKHRNPVSVVVPELPRRRRLPPFKPINTDLLKSMWYAGNSRSEICARVSITEVTLTKWLNRLELPKRNPGSCAWKLSRTLSYIKHKHTQSRAS